jgi:DNA invertase Pin-like site-specific DNA recombinase
MILNSPEDTLHTFVYARVSTSSQTNDNQVIEIEQAGYEADTIYTDTVSGKVPAMARPEFARLMDTILRTRKPKRLIVTKLDRLGRDASDITATVKALSAAGCEVRVLQFGDLDVTSTTGKLVLATLAAVAEMERDILIERTNAGLARARSQGKRFGRPNAADNETVTAIRQKLMAGISISQIAREHEVSRATVHRIRDGSGVYHRASNAVV